MNPQNYSKISFPAFKLEMNPPRDIVLPGGIAFNLYGLVISIGLVLAVIYGLRRRKQFGFLENDILDGVLCIVPFAVICARLYYCIFEWASYKDNPLSMLFIWEGGLAIYGGIIGAAIGMIVLCKVKKIKLPALFDLVALGFLIGQSIGRWGNFFNREAVGVLKEGSTLFIRMGLYNELGFPGGWEYYHPTFLYESLWNAVGFIGLHFLSKKRKYDGQIALGYVAWYGLGRTFIEGLREDSLYWGPVRVSQMLAAITCFIAVAILVINFFRYHNPADLYANQVVDELEAEEEAKKKAKEEKKARRSKFFKKDEEVDEEDEIEEDEEEIEDDEEDEIDDEDEDEEDEDEEDEIEDEDEEDEDEEESEDDDFEIEVFEDEEEE